MFTHRVADLCERISYKNILVSPYGNSTNFEDTMRVVGRDHYLLIPYCYPIASFPRGQTQPLLWRVKARLQSRGVTAHLSPQPSAPTTAQKRIGEGMGDRFFNALLLMFICHSNNLKESGASF